MRIPDGKIRMNSKDQNTKAGRPYYMAVPPGTPYSIMAEAAKKLNLTVEELEMTLPQTDDELYVSPRTLVLKGSKKNLLRAKEFIREKLEERIRIFSGDK